MREPSTQARPLQRAVCLFLTGLLAYAPAFGQGDYRKGLSYFKQGQYQKAIDEFEPLLQEHPDYESGHRIVGLSYLYLKQYEKAISELRAALRLKQDFAETYLGLAQAYYNSKRFREVIPTLNQAEPHAKSPRSRFDLLRIRGSAAYNLNQYERTVADLEEASTLQPIRPVEQLQLGLAHFQLEHMDQAEQALEKVLASNPEQAEARRFLLLVRYRRGVAMIEKGKYQEAADAISAYTEQVPDDAEAWFNLGLAYLFADNLPAARAAFLRDVGLRPDKSGPSSDRLGYIYEKNKEYKKALEYYEKAAAQTGSQEARASVDRIKQRIRRSSG